MFEIIATKSFWKRVFVLLVATGAMYYLAH